VLQRRQGLNVPGVFHDTQNCALHKAVVRFVRATEARRCDCQMKKSDVEPVKGEWAHGRM